MLRLGVAAWGIPLIIAAIAFGGWVFSLFVAVVAAVALYEFYSVSETLQFNPQTFPAVFFAFASVFLTAFMAAGSWLILMLCLAVLLVFIEIRFGERKAYRDLPLTLFGWAYIPLFLGTLVFVRGGIFDDLAPSAGYTLYFLSSIWICDTAAYAGGKNFGRLKMAPFVSPNKTWEGAFFGLIGALLWALLWIPFLARETNVADLIYVALIVGIIGQLGDLLESYFKRSAEVKDMSNLLPEHGGILDRFDSLILSAPFVFVYQVAMGRIALF